VKRVANCVKTTISDNRNTGNEDKHFGDIIAQNNTKMQQHPGRIKEQRHYT